IDDAFINQGMNRVEIHCAAGNIPSRAIPERLGFKQDGVMREAGLINGQFVNKVIYSMLVSEWNKEFSPTKTHEENTKGKQEPRLSP
ncbi:MAG: GNAT family protein, partial [Acidobacteriota bacterium]